MKTNVHFWTYLTQFFSVCLKKKKKDVEKIKIHIYVQIFFEIVLFVRYSGGML